jgi:DNA-binding transcriptional ArsR family regulator
MIDEYLQERLERAARCLKVLAHPIRLMIIHLLGEGELSVQELEKAVGISQSSVSQHLGLLRDKEILESRRVAQQVFYRLRDARLLKLTAGWSEAGAAAPDRQALSPEGETGLPRRAGRAGKLYLEI